jgi:hypothetical protein
MKTPLLCRAGGWLLGVVAVAGLSAGVAAQPPAAADAAQRRVAGLKLGLKAVDEENRDVEGRLKVLREDVEKLRSKVETIPAPAAPPVKKDDAKADATEIPFRPGAGGAAAAVPEKKGAKEVDFRLARSRDSDRKSNLGVVCLERKVYLMNFPAINEAVREELRVNKDFIKTGGTVRAKAGDFDLKLTVTGGTQFGLRRELVLKTDHAGESAERAKAPGSALRTRLDALDPAENVIQFCVYPDSFDTFREIRALVWGQKFDEVGWLPFRVGEPILLGGGPATAQ